MAHVHLPQIGKSDFDEWNLTTKNVYEENGNMCFVWKHKQSCLYKRVSREHICCLWFLIQISCGWQSVCASLTSHRGLQIFKIYKYKCNATISIILLIKCYYQGPDFDVLKIS